MSHHRLKHIEDLKSNQTYERVLRQNVSQRVLSHRWVDKPHRSRYTVRGYEQELTGSEDFYAPTPLSCLVKTILVCAEREGHTVCFGDCTGAFLQSDLLEEIYVELPAEAQEPADVVWRLHKALPGVKGGPVAWGARIDGILGSSPLNFRRSRVHPCLWTNSTTGGPYWSPHGRLHHDRSARGSTSCHEVPGACGTAQDYGCSGSVWQTGTILGFIHH